MRDKVDLICGALLSKSEILNKLGDFQGSKHILIKAHKLKTPNLQERELIERNLRIVAVMVKCEDKLVISTDQKELKSLYEKMGDCACDLKNFEKAIEYYKKMLDCAEKCGATAKELSTCYYCLAETYKDNNQYEEAIKYYEKEFEFCKNNVRDSLETLIRIADTLESNAASEGQVREIFERAFKVCQDNGNRKEEKRMICRYLDYLKRIGNANEIQHMERVLQSFADVSMDEESSDSENEVENKEKIGDDICLDDLTDISDESDSELGQQESRVRKRCRNYVVKKNIKGETQLHTACINGSLPVVRHLIEQGHPINVRDNCGWLPLHEACIHGHLEVVQLLLDKGAAINDRGGTLCNGVTPIHDACSNGHLEIVQLLLDRGASAVVKTDDGETPLHTLLSWQQREDPRGSQLELYEKIVKRLSTALEKFGQQVKPCSPTKTSPVYSLDKENESRIGKLRRSYTDFNESDESEEENINLSFESASKKSAKNASSEYRQVINALRNKSNVQKTVSRSNDKVKRPALISENDDLQDDWLDDDIKIVKKRRVASDKISPKQKIKESSLLYKSVSSSSSRQSLDDDFDLPNNYFEEVMDDYEYRPRSVSRCSNSSSSSSIKRKQQSLFDSGFRKTSPSPIKSGTQPRKSSQHKTTSIQMKINRFMQDDLLSNRNNDILDINSQLPSTILTQNKNHTSPVIDVSQNQMNAPNDPTLFVDVRIERRLYRVPVLLSQLQTHTIKWLAEQAADRYARKEYMKPSLELETVNGAVLADDDSLNLLFPLGSMQAEIVEARVLKFEMPKLVDRYKEACNQMNIDQNHQLITTLEEASMNLDLSYEGIRGTFLTPLCKALAHQTTLLELNLSANFLSTDCIKLLSTSLPTLTNLTKLNLSSCLLQPMHISILASYFTNSAPPKLTEIDFSYNNMGNECLKYLALLFQLLNLTVVNLAGINLNSLVFNLDFYLNLNNCKSLNISENDLDARSLSKFFTFLNFEHLNYLNISNNTGNTCGVLDYLIKEVESRSIKYNVLKSLGISRCNITDSEIFKLKQVLEELEFVNLEYNQGLTGISLKRLLDYPSLKHINLIGCDNIFTFVDGPFLNDIQISEKIKLLKVSNYKDINQDLFDILISKIPNVDKKDLIIRKFKHCLSISRDK